MTRKNFRLVTAAALALSLLCFFPHRAHGQVAVGITGGSFVTAQNCQACTLNMANATTGTLATGRGGTGLTGFGGTGALLYSTSSSVLAALAASTNGYFLQLSAGLPTWSQTLGVANGGTGLNATTAGGILYGTGATSLASLAAGTSGYLFQSGGTGAPSWVAPTAIAAGGLIIGSQTLWSTPATGEIGYISADNTWAKAKADSSTTVNAQGIYQGTASTLSISGALTCLLVASLTLNPGDLLYLSDATAGRMTNVAPSTAGHFAYQVAVLVDNTGYNSGAGSAQSCIFRPSFIQAL